MCVCVCGCLRMQGLCEACYVDVDRAQFAVNGLLAVEYIRSLCQQEDSRYRVQLVGSYRRGAATCGDIDILLTHERYS